MDKNLNLSITGTYPKVAIVTHNYEQREAIEKAMRAEHPKLMELWEPWELAGDGEIHEYESCIALHIYDNECDCVQVADEKYWQERGYVLMDFDLLLERPVDFGELDHANCDVDQLFT